MAVNDLAAFVLAGGKSSRMGRDKAFLEFGGKTLLRRALDLAGSVTADVAIVGDKTKFSTFGKVVEDVYRDCGPLGGIHAALAHTSAPLSLVLAVDLPFVEPSFLALLVAWARETDAVVTVPRSSRGWEPLCAVYRREFAAHAHAALAAGKNKIDLLFASLKVRGVEEKEWQGAGFTAQMFCNVNTPEELRRALESK